MYVAAPAQQIPHLGAKPPQKPQFRNVHLHAHNLPSRSARVKQNPNDSLLLCSSLLFDGRSYAFGQLPLSHNPRMKIRLFFRNRVLQLFR
jgi:hypothetical protein